MLPISRPLAGAVKAVEEAAAAGWEALDNTTGAAAAAVADG